MSQSAAAVLPTTIAYQDALSNIEDLLADLEACSVAIVAETARARRACADCQSLLRPWPARVTGQSKGLSLQGAGGEAAEATEAALRGGGSAEHVGVGLAEQMDRALAVARKAGDETGRGGGRARSGHGKGVHKSTASSTTRGRGRGRGRGPRGERVSGPSTGPAAVAAAERARVTAERGEPFDLTKQGGSLAMPGELRKVYREAAAALEQLSSNEADACRTHFLCRAEEASISNSGSLQQFRGADANRTTLLRKMAYQRLMVIVQELARATVPTAADVETASEAVNLFRLQRQGTLLLEGVRALNFSRDGEGGHRGQSTRGTATAAASGYSTVGSIDGVETHSESLPPGACADEDAMGHVAWCDELLEAALGPAPSHATDIDHAKEGSRAANAGKRHADAGGWLPADMRRAPSIEQVAADIAQEVMKAVAGRPTSSPKPSSSAVGNQLPITYFEARDLSRLTACGNRLQEAQFEIRLHEHATHLQSAAAACVPSTAHGDTETQASAFAELYRLVHALCQPAGKDTVPAFVRG